MLLPGGQLARQSVARRDESVEGPVRQHLPGGDDRPGTPARHVPVRGRPAVTARAMVSAMTDGGEASAENDSSTAAMVAACFWYAVPAEAWRSFCAEMVPHSVRIAPGSMMTTSMPNGRSSTRRLSLSPSTANLAAWYQSPSGS